MVNPISYCPVCGEPTARVVSFGDNSFTLPLACKCARAKQKEFEEETERNRRMRLSATDILIRITRN